jgi:hypothetical protein
MYNNNRRIIIDNLVFLGFSFFFLVPWILGFGSCTLSLESSFCILFFRFLIFTKSLNKTGKQLPHRNFTMLPGSAQFQHQYYMLV